MWKYEKLKTGQYNTNSRSLNMKSNWQLREEVIWESWNRSWEEKYVNTVIYVKKNTIYRNLLSWQKLCSMREACNLCVPGSLLRGPACAMWEKWYMTEMCHACLQKPVLLASGGGNRLLGLWKALWKPVRVCLWEGGLAKVGRMCAEGKQIILICVTEREERLMSDRDDCK